MVILLIGGLLVIIGLCLAIEGILARLPLSRDKGTQAAADQRATAQAAFEATVTQEDEHWRKLQRQAVRYFRL